MNGDHERREVEKAMSNMSEAPVLSAAELWRRVTDEARALAAGEPVLASFVHVSLLNHGSLAAALGYLLAGKLGCTDLGPMLIREVCNGAYADEPELVEMASADACAHFNRDPACSGYAIPLLYFKGFHALQAWRVANFLWRRGRHSLALFLQNRIAIEFDVDIHPAARIGRGVMVDHATGMVIGETAAIGDNVSMLHGVTLGGCGITGGVRHPQVGDGVLISVGAKLLGPIRVGDGARIAGGSVVLADVAPYTTVAGVPARPVGRQQQPPAFVMNQDLNS
jgi:serine O-acetyltransferase